MYPNFINLRAEWLLSIRAPLISSETLCGGCLTAGGSSADPPPRQEVPGLQPHTEPGWFVTYGKMLKNETLHGTLL